VSSGIVARRAAYLAPGPEAVEITLSRSPRPRCRSWAASACAGALVFGAGKGGYPLVEIQAGVRCGCPAQEALDHDLRRTGRTGLGLLGVAPHIAKAVLNHLPPKLMRTTRTSNEKEKRRRWIFGLRTWCGCWTVR